jgi:hypothetical protein
VGGHVDLGYDRGKFVPYTDEFKAMISSIKEKKEWEEQIGKHIEEKKKDEEK